MACGGCRRRCYWLSEKLDLTCELVKEALWLSVALGVIVAVGLLVGR